MVKKSKTDECQELKNLKYKTMLLNGNNIEESQNSCSIDQYLKQKEESNKDKLIWSKF